MKRESLPGRTTARHRTEAFRRGGTVLLSGLLLSSLAAGLMPAGAARADDLDDQQSALQQQISSSDTEVTAEDRALLAARSALDDTRRQLADAQAALAEAQSARDAAARDDAQAQSTLDAADAALAGANDDLAKAKAAVVAQRQAAGSDVRAVAQQNSSLVALGLWVSNLSTADLSDRAQWTSQAFHSQQSTLDALNSAELSYEQAQQHQQAVEQTATTRREAAARALRTAQQTADTAAAAQQKVNALVAQQQGDQDAAAKALAAAQARNAELKAQAQALAEKITQRNEERAAEAARQAAAAQQAAEQAAAAQKNQAEAAADAASATASAASNAAAGRSTASSTGSVLIDPVPGAPMTSPYGYRTNPVLGTKELHDGVDLGGACGAPIYAAASGTVAEILTPEQSGGYGNRLVIDHGLVNGVYLSTGYNHAQDYLVGVGQQVSQGQLIGHVGTTGLSTGCHLHFHVYVNGTAVDPMGWITLD